MPFTQIHEVSPASAQRIVLERALAPLAALEEAVARLELGRDESENLARSGALECYAPRREAKRCGGCGGCGERGVKSLRGVKSPLTRS